jgi:hypothetical protein
MSLKLANPRRVGKAKLNYPKSYEWFHSANAPGGENGAALV